MSYAERAQAIERPRCWGDKDAFNPVAGDECDECRFQHSCRSEIDRKATASRTGYSPVSSYTPSYSPRVTPSYGPSRPASPAPYTRGTEYSTWEPGKVKAEETVVSRLLKDGAVGAARGAAWEWYRFFTVYRWM